MVTACFCSDSGLEAMQDYMRGLNIEVFVSASIFIEAVPHEFAARQLAATSGIHREMSSSEETTAQVPKVSCAAQFMECKDILMEDVAQGLRSLTASPSRDAACGKEGHAPDGSNPTPTSVLQLEDALNEAVPALRASWQ